MKKSGFRRIAGSEGARSETEMARIRFRICDYLYRRRPSYL